MSFYNDCCRVRMIPADSGQEFTCECGNAFIYDGARWKNTLEIGQRKVEKLRRILAVNLRVRTSAEEAGLKI